MRYVKRFPRVHSTASFVLAGHRDWEFVDSIKRWTSEGCICFFDRLFSLADRWGVARRIPRPLTRVFARVALASLFNDNFNENIGKFVACAR